MCDTQIIRLTCQCCGEVGSRILETHQCRSSLRRAQNNTQADFTSSEGESAEFRKMGGEFSFCSGFERYSVDVPVFLPCDLLAALLTARHSPANSGMDCLSSQESKNMARVNDL